MLQKVIESLLARYQDPYLKKDLLTAKTIKKIHINDEQVEVELSFGYPLGLIKDSTIEAITNWLKPASPDKSIKVTITTQIEPHAGNAGLSTLPNVKNIIAVGSGKGGVGKSTVSINLALALMRAGARVGILDADIYGPSQPTMLGTAQEKPVIQDKTLHPILRHGLQSMSIGYLIDPNAPMVWRGPMLGKALQQLLGDTKWDALDYLIVDLPPGTGDIQLTLCQKIPVSGAVIVTTPQDLALLDVTRACEMFQKLNVPILGIVENMSLYHCEQCGHETHIFGEGGAKKLSETYQVPLLGSVPLALPIREMTDSGTPPVVKAPDSEYAKTFYEIARHTAARLALQAKDYSAKFPKITVETIKKQE